MSRVAGILDPGNIEDNTLSLVKVTLVLRETHLT